MKKSKIWSMMMLVAMTLPMTVACGGSDDEESSVRSQLIGFWQTNMASSVWNYIELKADGTFLFDLHIKDNETLQHYYPKTHIGIWSYNEQEKTISIVPQDSYHEAYTYNVSMINENAWTGYRIDSKGSAHTYSFTRLQGTFKIVGVGD